MTLRSRFLLLTCLRWLPTGLIVPVYALLPLQRGLSIAELGGVVAVQGIVILCLELPTGGLTDALGRKPVFVASAALALASYVTVSMAHTVLVFAVATALAGASRALDSGPLNAWFVDAVHGAHRPGRDPEPAIAGGLGRAGAVIGMSLAAGSVASSVLVLWAPLGDSSSLAVPYVMAAVLAVLQLIGTLALMDEDRSGRSASLVAALRATPAAIGDGLRVLRRSRALRALVVMQIFWGFGIVAFETLTPIRMSELLGSRDEAASVMGPVTAAAWGLSAAGAMLVPVVLRRWSAVTVSICLRLVQGATVVAMGLVAGPVGVVIAFLATYGVHSASGAIYEMLLHRQAGPDNRATVLSLASMTMQPAGSLGAVTLTAVAAGWSTGAAMVGGGIVLALAAPLFLVKDPVSAAAELRGDAGCS